MAFEESAFRSKDASVRSSCLGRISRLMEKLFQTFKTNDDQALNDICDSYSKEIE